MEQEHRIEKLEHELAILKEDLQGTLLAIQKSLPEKPDSPSRWQKRAWVLALLNILLAITLFTNIRFYTPDGSPPGTSSLLGPWLQAFWVALAFLWLILQMYPLALLLDQENDRSREAALRQAASLFKSNPGLTLALTLLVLVVTVASVLFPSLWLMLMAVLLVVVCVDAARYLLWSHRQPPQ